MRGKSFSTGSPIALAIAAATRAWQNALADTAARQQQAVNAALVAFQYAEALAYLRVLPKGVRPLHQPTPFGSTLRGCHARWRHARRLALGVSQLFAS
jgi:hypothetical protein